MKEIQSHFETIRQFSRISLFGTDVVHVVFSVATFCVILLLCYFLKNFVMKLFQKSISNSQNEIYRCVLEAVKLPLHVVLIFFSLWVGFYTLGAERLFVAVNHASQTIFLAAGILAVYRSMDVIVLVVKKYTPTTDLVFQQYLTVIISKVIKLLIIVIGAIMLLKEWGYDATGLIAGLGVGGLAISWGAKDFVANIFGFATIFLDRPFAVGDWIETPDVEGTVEDIGLRSTRIRTFAQALVTIPNCELAFKRITNWSKMRKRRITFTLGLSYGSSAGKIGQACSEIRNMLKDHSDIDKEVILVYFTAYGNSSLDLFLYFFTKTTVWKEFLEVQHDVNLRIMKILEELSLQVAFPSRSIYMENFSQEGSKILRELDRRFLAPAGTAQKESGSEGE